MSRNTSELTGTTYVVPEKASKTLEVSEHTFRKINYATSLYNIYVDQIQHLDVKRDYETCVHVLKAYNNVLGDIRQDHPEIAKEFVHLFRSKT